jgi:antitoxin VbhA-like protein
MSADTISVEEQGQRRAALRDALAQVRLEGMEPHPAFFDYAEAYVRGEITIDEAVARFVAEIQRHDTPRSA